MRAHIAVLCVGLITFVGASAPADDATVTNSTVTHIPDRYLVSQGVPHGFNGQSAQAQSQAASPTKTVRPTADASTAPNTPPLDGSFYAEIFPLFDGSDGNTSYLRLGTTSTTSSTFDVTVLGEPSGALYGYGQETVPGNSSPQIPFTQVLTDTGSTPLANGDTGYALYLDNSDANSYYQHVIFNGNNNFFEDMTICPMGASLQSATTINNIHTTLLSAFPSTVYIHNYLDVAADYKVTVIDARTGLTLGTIADLNVPANSTYAVAFSWFQQQINFTPNSNQQHANLQFAATAAFATALGAGPNPTDLGALLGMSVLNQTFTAVLNLSNKCIVNR